MSIVEYGKKNCMKCKMTKKWFENHNIPFKYIDVEDDEKSLNMLKSMRHKTLPVVFKDEKFFFSDFDIKKLETLIK